MKKGIVYSILAYLLWGFFPMYFKLLTGVPAVQITAHRVVWSFIFLMILIFATKQWNVIRAALKPRTVLIYLVAGALLTMNWLTFVWAVTAGYVVEASLGYFINPLVSVLLGVVFLREKLRPVQWLPIGLAAVGVLYLTINYGAPPWIALILATTFGLYGLIKKIAPLDSLPGTTYETGAMVLFALGYLLFAEFSGVGVFGHTAPATNLFLVLTGVVTAVPLLLFAGGVRSVPLSTVGLLQYINPTIQFLTGVFIYGEAFSVHSLIGFGAIWLALIIFSTESYLNFRKVPEPAGI
jgi:chloramphenicol-sensitive protein RarD